MSRTESSVIGGQRKYEAPSSCDLSSFISSFLSLPPPLLLSSAIFLPSAYGESSASSYNMAGEKGPTKRSAMDIKRLASLIQRGAGRLLVIDSRTFSEYNASHVQGAINVCCSKLVKRRLQQDKVSVTELLQPNGKVKVELGRKQEVVVYDQNSKEVGQLSKDGFVQILMGKLESTFHRVSLLT
ncbi:Dual specificity protein phosphatase 8, partial [Takifugu flavidus]